MAKTIRQLFTLGYQIWARLFVVNPSGWSKSVKENDLRIR